MEQDLRWESHERQYTLTDLTFTKSELPEEELPISQATQQRVYPRWSHKRLRNETATLRFIASNSSIPVPKFRGLYEENGLLHLKTEHAIGIPLDDLASDIATKHIADYIESSILPRLRELLCHFSQNDETDR
jgi:hypothetical protein